MTKFDWRVWGARFAAAAFLAIVSSTACSAVTIEWTQQLGSGPADVNQGVSADALGNVFIAGFTKSSLGGPNAGNYDTYVSKYNAAGGTVWTRQLGTAGADGAFGASADGAGNVYIAGDTTGSLAGNNPDTFQDPFVAKYDAAGNALWTRQLNSAGLDRCTGVSADGLGSVYVAGRSQGNLGGTNIGSDDAFVAKYSAAGALQWTRKLGTLTYDGATGVAADALGNVFIAGSTIGSLGGPAMGNYDAFVSKYDASGNLLWTKQFGTAAEDQCYSVAVDGLGSAYVGGETYGDLVQVRTGSSDAFVRKYDSAGNALWTRQYGPADSDGALGLFADAAGRVYATGNGFDAPGADDSYVRRFDGAGNTLWELRYSTNDSDNSTGVSADGLGAVYVSRNRVTAGGLSFPMTTKVSDPVPEPQALTLAFVSGLVARGRRTWRRRRR